MAAPNITLGHLVTQAAGSQPVCRDVEASGKYEVIKIYYMYPNNFTNCPLALYYNRQALKD